MYCILIFFQIGYSCQLLTQSISLLTMNTKSLDQTREQLVNLIEDFGDRIRMENDFALIVDGEVSVPLPFSLIEIY